MGSDKNNNIDRQSESRATTSVLLYFLRMFASPINGWKKVKAAALRPDDVATRLFYPMLALISAGEFFQLFYDSTLSVASLLQDAIMIFVAFFASNFSILFLIDFLFKKEIRAKLTTDFGKNLILMSLTTLALFYLLYEILPLAAPLLVFTPIYTLYLIIKGGKCLRVPEQSFSITIFKLALLIIGLPILIYRVFDVIMPTV